MSSKFSDHRSKPEPVPLKKLNTFIIIFTLKYKLSNPTKNIIANSNVSIGKIKLNINNLLKKY